MKRPKIDRDPAEPLAEDELRGMIRACQMLRVTDPKEVFRRRRNEAIIRLMSESGARASQTADRRACGEAQPPGQQRAKAERQDQQAEAPDEPGPEHGA
jgi:hypothetical protein